MVQDTIKKSAHVAVGLPVHLVKVLRERLALTQEMVQELRTRLSDDAAAAFDNWVAEGERLVSGITENIQERREAVEATMERSIETAKDVGRGLGVTLTTPIVPLETIKGLGPKYAEELGDAGVISTRALVERCRTEDAIERLAEQTGIGAALLTKWVAAADLSRIDGVGDEAMTLLNGVGVGTLDQLAKQDAGDLHRRAGDFVAETGVVSTVPSSETLTEWIAAAKKLV